MSTILLRIPKEDASNDRLNMDTANSGKKNTLQNWEADRSHRASFASKISTEKCLFWIHCWHTKHRGRERKGPGKERASWLSTDQPGDTAHSGCISSQWKLIMNRLKISLAGTLEHLWCPNTFCELQESHKQSSGILPRSHYNAGTDARHSC